MSDILATFGPHKDLLYSAVLADILDGLGHRTSVLPTYLRPLRPDSKLFGRAATLSCIRVAREPSLPFALEMEFVDALRPGDVVVATTHGDHGSAIWGELLSTGARAHGATGAVIDGATRDVAKIVEMRFPVFAASYTPLDSRGRLDGVSRNVPVRIGECAVQPGDWVYGDIDGVVVVPAERADQVFPQALEKVRGENRVREELAKGRSVREVFAEYKIL